MKAVRTLLILFICGICAIVAWMSGHSAVERAKYAKRNSQTTRSGTKTVASRTLQPLEIDREPANQNSKASGTKLQLHSPVVLSKDAATASMQKMLDVIHTAVSSSEHFEDVLNKISDQTPKVYRDSNPDTGEMLTVRTENPWPGTRYVHMQFVGEVGAQNHFLQHAAFEFKPGAESLARVADAIRNEFPSLSEPTQRTNEYVRWNAGSNYVVWAKTLTQEDMDSDLFNAYSPEDIGTVRIVVEKGVHEDGE